MGLLYYIAWEPLKNYARYGYTYKVNYLMVPLLLIAIVPTGVMEAQWQMMENKGSHIVQQVSGKKEASLKCQRLSNTFIDKYPLYAGYVEHKNPDKAIVKYRECKRLMKYFKHPQKPAMEQTTALNTLIHESVHVNGEFNESITECRAHYEHIKQATSIGTPEEIVINNLATYIRDYYPRLPDQYRTDDGCNGYHQKLLSYTSK